MTVKPGIYAASMSLLNKDLSLDIDSTISHIEKLVKDGCHGVAIFGSTGAGQLISRYEKEKLVEKISNNQFKPNSTNIHFSNKYGVLVQKGLIWK